MWCLCGHDGCMEGWEWGANGHHVCDTSVTATIKLIVCRHDFNDTLDDKKLFPDGSVIEKHWLNYARDIFGVDNEGQGNDTDREDGPPRKKISRGQKRPEITLPVLDDGTAQLLNVLEMRAQEKKDLLRTFLTHHYCKYPTHRNFSLIGPQVWCRGGAKPQCPG